VFSFSSGLPLPTCLYRKNSTDDTEFQKAQAGAITRHAAERAEGAAGRLFNSVPDQEGEGGLVFGRELSSLLIMPDNVGRISRFSALFGVQSSGSTADDLELSFVLHPGR